MVFSSRGPKGLWRQRAANRLTCGVIGLQLAVLLTLWVTPTWSPPRMKLFELLWAWMHRPTFYPFIAMTVGGPLMSLMAWLCRGRHRLWLTASWLAFLAVLMRFYGDRVEAMIRVLWWMYSD